MKQVFLLAVLLLRMWPTVAQSTDMLFYYPDGKPYKKACRTISDINADFDNDGRIGTFSPMCWDSARYDCFVVIGYKLFTDRPLWVFTNNRRKIPEFLSAFDYTKYLESTHLDSDFKDHIIKKTLTDEFIMETFGLPNRIDRNPDIHVEREHWVYLKPAIMLTFEDGLVIAYQRFEPSAIEGRKD